MLIPLILLTALSLVVMIAGIAWTLALSGQVRTRTGADMGAAMMAEHTRDDEEEEIIVAKRTAFSG
jgi:hypothetical protein